MATSGITTWTENTSKIVERSYKLVGHLAMDEPMSASMLSYGIELLNSMVKSWQMEGVRLWTKQEAEANISVSTSIIGTDGQSYRCIRSHISAASNKPITGANWTTYWTLGGSSAVVWASGQNYVSAGDLQVDSNVKSIEKAFYRSNGFDFPVDVIETERYLDIPNKGDMGYPIVLVADKKILPTVYLWPIPDNDPNIVIHYFKVKLFDDFTQGTDNADFPVSWVECLVWSLAYRMGYEYGIDLKRLTMIGTEAARLKTLAKVDDREIEDETFVYSAFGRGNK